MGADVRDQACKDPPALGAARRRRTSLRGHLGLVIRSPAASGPRSACGCCLQDRAKVPPQMFRNGPAMCAQPAGAAFLLALNNPALQVFHQHLQSLFSRAVPSVPDAASPLMSAATRPPARAGKLTDSDLYLYVRRCIADTTDEASTPCLYRQGVAKLPIVANIKNQEKRSARRRGAWTSLILPCNVLFSVPSERKDLRIYS